MSLEADRMSLQPADDVGARQGAPLGTYYVVMCDFGRRGREAVVDPELTRRAIVERIARRDFAHDNVIALHQVALGEPALDITADVLRDAGIGDSADAALQPQEIIKTRNDPHYAARMRRLAGVA